MAVLANPSLTNSQPHALWPRTLGVGRAVATLRLWRQRSRERQALGRLTDRELQDIGATTSDVYRELAAPFWRSLPPC